MGFFDNDEDLKNKARDKYADALAFIMLRWKDPETNEELKPGHPFFHTFASSLRYVETDGFDKGMGKKDPLALAAVGFTAQSPIGRLFINPQNFLNLSLTQAAGLIVHELLHIVYDHLHYEQARTHPKIWNIATDCTINQQVRDMCYDLPSGKNILSEDMDFEVKGITPETLGESFKCAPPEPDQHAMFYFNWLIEKLKEVEKNRKPCPDCGGTGQKQKQEEEKCPVHPNGKQDKNNQEQSGDSKNTLPQSDLDKLAEKADKNKGDKGNQDGQEGQEGSLSKSEGDQESSEGESGQEGQKGQPGQDQGMEGNGDSQSGDSDSGDPGDSGESGQGDSGDSHEHGQGGDQCTCKGGDQPGDGDGDGDGSEGSGDPSGGQGQGSCGSGSGHGDGSGEPCDCCNGTGGYGMGMDDLINELNGRTNHGHWEDLTPEEKEIIRRFEAQATQSAKGHHEGTSGLPGEIAGQIANKVKALEPEIDWQQELRKFIGGSGTVTPVIKKSRLNKYGLPGKMVMMPNSAIAVVCDTSGFILLT